MKLDLAGQRGEALANESVEAVRNVVTGLPAPPGVHAYVIGPCHSRQSDAPWARHFSGQVPRQ